MIEIRSFASSSRGNCYLVSDGATRLLLECGIRLRDIRQRTGFSVRSIAGVLISHEHGDHARAAVEMVRLGVDLFASRGTLQALGVNGHRAHICEPRRPVVIGTWMVVPFEAFHDAEEPLGFLLSSKAGKVLYLTDSAYSRYRFDGITHIMLECNYSLEILRRNVRNGSVPSVHKTRVLRNHMGLDRVLEFLRANDLSKVEEIYLLHLSDGNSDAEQFKAAVMAATGKPVIVAEREGG